MKLNERYNAIVERFEKEMPVVDTELHFDNPYQLLVAVILSAQCTDKRVNMVTPAVFEAYPTPEALAGADRDALFELIKSISYPNNKTKSLLGMARRLVDVYGGRVPDTMDELLTLPGVGRKTANVMLSVIYKQPTMAVDTHVFRVAERLGLTTNSRTPLSTERKLLEHLPEEVVGKAHHWLILHGRYVCKARKPECDSCLLADVCRKHSRDLAREARKLERINQLRVPKEVHSDSDGRE